MSNHLQLLSDAEIFAIVESLTKQFGQDPAVISTRLGISEEDAAMLLKSFYGDQELTTLSVDELSEVVSNG